MARAPVADQQEDCLDSVDYVSGSASVRTRGSVPSLRPAQLSDWHPVGEITIVPGSDDGDENAVLGLDEMLYNTGEPTSADSHRFESAATIPMATPARFNQVTAEVDLPDVLQQLGIQQGGHHDHQPQRQDQQSGPDRLHNTRHVNFGTYGMSEVPRVIDDVNIPTTATIATADTATWASSVVSEDRFGPTTELHEASATDNVEAIRHLLEQGQDIQARDGNHQTALHLAAKVGCLESVQELLNHGAKVNAPDMNGNTPLHLATMHVANRSVVATLLEHRASVQARNRNGDTPLITAAASLNDKDVILALVEGGANIEEQGEHQRNALHRASEKGHRDVVEVLMANGADVNAADENMWTGLHLASENGHVGVVKVLLDKLGADNVGDDKKHRWAPVQVSPQDKKNPVVEFVKDKGASIVRNIRGRGHSRDGATHHDEPVALYVSADRQGRVGQVEYLEDNAVSIDARTNTGATALHIASKNNHLDIVKMLLARGASLKASDEEGWTALHHACGDGSSEVVRWLVEKRASVYATTVAGATPLHLASQNGDVGTVACLLIQGHAELHPRTHGGLTPLWIARKMGNDDAVRFLTSRGDVR